MTRQTDQQSARETDDRANATGEEANPPGGDAETAGDTDTAGDPR